jgi:hypothetical protein
MADTPVPASVATDDGRAQDFFQYGLEEILRGSDTGILVAFAAIAFQQIRDDKQPHYDAGVGILLFSVFLCAVVHFAIGNSFVSRARRLLRRRPVPDRPSPVRRVTIAIAILAGLLQFACVVAGLMVLLLPGPPDWLKDCLQAGGFRT